MQTSIVLASYGKLRPLLFVALEDAPRLHNQPVHTDAKKVGSQMAKICLNIKKCSRQGRPGLDFLSKFPSNP
jgi:hypothetical protein